MNNVPYIKLAELCSVNQGLQIPISKRHKSNGKNRYFYITVQFLKDSHNEKYYVENPPLSSICNEDDIIVVRTGSTGQILTGIRGCFHNNFFKVNYDKDKVVGKYLYYCLTSKEKQKEMKNRAGITTIPDLNHFMFLDMKIPLPNYNIQQNAAKLLDSINEKIELNNKINAELEAMAKLIYDYWFVQFDFSNANGKPYKSSGGKMVYNQELKKEIPEGWEVGTASDVFDFNPSLSIKKGVISSYIDMNTLPESGFMTKGVKKKEFYGGMKFQNGDVIIARITTCLENGKTGLITLLEGDEIGFGSTEFIVLRGKNIDLRSFASCLSRSEIFRKYAISRMTGTSGRKRVKSSALETYKMTIPNNNTLQRFEVMISPFFKKTTFNSKENQKLVELRDWLLPMLMNGQVAVGEAEEQVKVDLQH